MSEWVRLPLVAIQFLTRIPISCRLQVPEESLGKATMFFPLVGVIVGGGAALIYGLLQLVLPHSAAVFFSIMFAVLITNGFHEDGLADTFDGFGGGWTKERTLEIMRDSRIGTYGALALVFLIIGKYSFLSALAPSHIWRWLIVAHVASRWTIIPLCAWLPYARIDGQGRLVAKKIGSSELIIGSTTFFIVLSLLSWQAAVAALLATVLVTFLGGLYFRYRLSGITGDCLGAANQITEVSLYLTAIILTRFDLL